MVDTSLPVNIHTFEITKYDSNSDDMYIKYYEVLHYLCATMKMVAESFEKGESISRHTIFHTPIPLGQRIVKDVDSYVKILKESSERMDELYILQPYEKTILGVCGFLMVIVLASSNRYDDTILTQLFLDTTWNDFAARYGLRSLIRKLSFDNIVTSMDKDVCSSKKTEQWIRSNLEGWRDVCSKNISAIAQVNSIPGGNFDRAQQFITIMSLEDGTYVGSIHVLSREENDLFLIMGIMKNPLFELGCNEKNQYKLSFVPVLLDHVQTQMRAKNKRLMWTYPLENMGRKIEQIFEVHRLRENHTHTREILAFLTTIGLDFTEKLGIVHNPGGLYAISI